MNSSSQAPPAWSTASYGDATDTSPMELSALGEHLGLCLTLRGRVFGLRCVAETTHGLLAARFVTTLVVATALLAVTTLLS